MNNRTLSYIVRGKTTLAYSNIPRSVHLYACAAHGMIVTIKKCTVTGGTTTTTTNSISSSSSTPVISGNNYFEWFNNQPSDFDVSRLKLSKKGASKTYSVVSKNVFISNFTTFDIKIVTNSPG